MGAMMNYSRKGHKHASEFIRGLQTSCHSDFWGGSRHDWGLLGRIEAQMNPRLPSRHLKVNPDMLQIASGEKYDSLSLSLSMVNRNIDNWHSYRISHTSIYLRLLSVMINYFQKGDQHESRLSSKVSPSEFIRRPWTTCRSVFWAGESYLFCILIGSELKHNGTQTGLLVIQKLTLTCYTSHPLRKVAHFSRRSTVILTIRQLILILGQLIRLASSKGFIGGY